MDRKTRIVPSTRLSVESDEILGSQVQGGIEDVDVTFKLIERCCAEIRVRMVESTAEKKGSDSSMGLGA